VDEKQHRRISAWLICNHGGAAKHRKSANGNRVKRTSNDGDGAWPRGGSLAGNGKIGKTSNQRRSEKSRLPAGRPAGERQQRETSALKATANGDMSATDDRNQQQKRKRKIAPSSGGDGDTASAGSGWRGIRVFGNVRQRRGASGGIKTL